MIYHYIIMTHLSSRNLKSDNKIYLHQSFIQTFSDLSGREFETLYPLIITKTEKKMIEKRIGVIAMLANGIPEAQIENELKVTHQTIDRIKVHLKLADEKSINLLYRKLRTIKIKDLIKTILDTQRRASKRILPHAKN